MTQQTLKQKIEPIKQVQKPTDKIIKKDDVKTVKPDAPKIEPEKKAPAKLTKKTMVEQLLKQENGTTIDEVAEKTGWQKHTIRGHFSTLKKKGFKVTNAVKDGVRIYRIEETKPQEERS